MNFRNLDLNLLKVLDALFSEGSTVAAGARIGLSQPAVSAALGRLRHALNDPLFVRVGTRLEPTDYATSISEPLSTLLAQLEATLEPQQFDPRNSTAEFTLTSNDFFCSILMPRLSNAVSAEAPGIKIQMIEGRPEDYSAQINSGESDLLLAPEMLVSRSLERDHLFDMESVLVARQDNRRLQAAGIGPDDSIPLDLFCDLPQVLYSVQGGFVGLADDLLAKLGRRRNVVMSVSTFGGVMHTVYRSDLVGIIPIQYARDHGERLGLRFYQLPIDMPPIKLFMSWHPRSTNNPSQKWLRAKIKQVLEGL